MLFCKGVFGASSLCINLKSSPNSDFSPVFTTTPLPFPHRTNVPINAIFFIDFYLKQSNISRDSITSAQINNITGPIFLYKSHIILKASSNCFIHTLTTAEASKRKNSLYPVICLLNSHSFQDNPLLKPTLNLDTTSSALIALASFVYYYYIDHATTTYFNVTIIEDAIMSNNLPPELYRRCLKMFIAYFISLIINIVSKFLALITCNNYRKVSLLDLSSVSTKLSEVTASSSTVVTSNVATALVTSSPVVVAAFGIFPSMVFAAVALVSSAVVTAVGTLSWATVVVSELSATTVAAVNLSETETSSM
ncbi:hypothetical protein AGLY_007596 [Aphis glycines]|uniref:Uncharacterized protein n=1 Tax=Aphis glycines TaxID=307491 RepID=A0A6G0TMF8_APHGL|nr:hypothetical protein AGLY_007596 [Aphis glycines]